ncbi:MAG: Riboflavin biosynthesis protein RibF [Syntrophorhabdus sp. PtaU1.Bin058]|nr:MAG: Riboflavin biosynthesis protein RibF [Syntrophorhabdus sp. PtaU1.Bin058]
MKIFESLDIPERFTRPVLTIGNYDGIHVGHRKIIEQVKQKAKELSGTSMLMTFHPHPMSVLRPEKYTRIITPLHVKKRLIEETGIDVLIIVPFNTEFRNIEAEGFIKEVLIDRLGVAGIVVGYDFRFGKNGAGDIGMLRGFVEDYDLYLGVVDAVTVDGEKVGSNMIRKLIAAGDVDKAKRLLERPHMIDGVVVRGDGRGREIGFPTINLATVFELVPKEGVYITEVKISEKMYPSVTNIGHNPTFNDNRELTVETHIIGFSGDLYGERVYLYFHKRLRPEMKFRSVEELRARITKDVETARNYFSP